MKTIRFGILGCSNHFLKRVGLSLKQSVFVEMHGIASRDLAKAQKMGDLFDIPCRYGSYEELLMDSQIEAVYIPLPNHLHKEWIMKAADAGKHVLVEKPIALNAKEALEAYTYCQEKGVKLMEAFMYRFHPQWRAVYDLVRTNQIGSIKYIHTFFSYNNPNPGNIRNVLKYGGGGLMDIGCYAISVSRFLLGKEPEQVFASICRDSRTGVDIHVSAVMEFGEARSSFTVATQSDAFQRVEIIGSSGRITIPLPFNVYSDVPSHIEVTMNTGTRIVEHSPTDQYLEMFEAFAKSLLENKPVPTPVEDAIDNMKVIDALLRSEESKGWESVS